MTTSAGCVDGVAPMPLDEIDEPAHRRGHVDDVDGTPEDIEPAPSRQRRAAEATTAWCTAAPSELA